jgi:hypothetical protein
MVKKTQQHIDSLRQRTIAAIINTADLSLNSALLLYRPNMSAIELENISLTLRDLASACHEAAKAVDLLNELELMDTKTQELQGL